MIKILAIGNSFSQDATVYLEGFSNELFVRNAYIGGCSIERHINELNSDSKVYEYQANGVKNGIELYSLKDIIASEKWDYITVQQVSGLSGIESSYKPYLQELLNYLHTNTTAKIVFHQTWAYNKDFTDDSFAKYNYDFEFMHDSIVKTTTKIASDYNLPIIKTGEFIYNLKKYDVFNKEKGGISLHRDGFHLGMVFGRYAAACVWYKFFTGKIPSYLNRNDLTIPYKILKEELLKF